MRTWRTGSLHSKKTLSSETLSAKNSKLRNPNPKPETWTLKRDRGSLRLLQGLAQLRVFAGMKMRVLGLGFKV